MAELISRPLVEIAQELRERRLTSQEVVEAAIARHLFDEPDELVEWARIALESPASGRRTK